jgi:hypothetical protein
MQALNPGLLDFIPLTPELGIPPFDPDRVMDLMERAAAACETARNLAGYGLSLTTTPHDEEVAETIVAAYAQDPEHASRTVTTARFTAMTPASIVLTGAILEEFGHLVVRDSQRIRYLVTNKLLIESENPDARIRMRALELLGKMSDVGLFTEKKELTVRHTSSEELRADLKGKLKALIGAGDAAIAEYEDITPATREPTNEPIIDNWEV